MISVFSKNEDFGVGAGNIIFFYFFFRKIELFNKRLSYREKREREREIFYSQKAAKPRVEPGKSEAWNCVQVPTWATGAQALGLSFVAFPDALAVD